MNPFPPIIFASLACFCDICEQVTIISDWLLVGHHSTEFFMNLVHSHCQTESPRFKPRPLAVNGHVEHMVLFLFFDWTDERFRTVNVPGSLWVGELKIHSPWTSVLVKRDCTYGNTKRHANMWHWMMILHDLVHTWHCDVKSRCSSIVLCHSNVATPEKPLCQFTAAGPGKIHQDGEERKMGLN